MLAAAEPLQACPLCAGRHIAPFVVVKGFPYHRCDGCGFAFLNPMPSQLELNDEYQGHKGISTEHYPHAASRRRKALFRALGLMPRLVGRTVLDIGCGGGFFVDAARRIGARQATGIDVDASTIAYAKRHFPRCAFHCASFDTFAPDQPYDFLHSAEVIEHVQDPHAFMRLLGKCSRVGSHVFITTPDLASPGVPADAAEWPGFAPPAHVGLFSGTNLLSLFQRYGFDVVRVMPPRKTGIKVLFRRMR